MRIRGTVEVEGVRLVVDVEAPDDDREVFVTNISPNCLVIPRDRWPVSWLDLDAEALAALSEVGARTLGELTDGQWQVCLADGLESYRERITAAVSQLRACALTFETEVEAVFEPGREPIPIRTHEEPVEERAVTPVPPPVECSLESGLAQLGVPVKIAIILERTREVRTVRDLIALGRRKLVMTSGVSSKDIKGIEVRLARAGFDWKTAVV